jgi:NAD(P)-dependent dehydrogenase (short-subunit alcohol dehydrogenase family)
MQNTLQQRPIAAITGGASGIGLASAERWVAGGGSVVLMDLRQAGIDNAVAQLGAESARGVCVDVTDDASVVAAFDSVTGLRDAWMRW